MKSAKFDNETARLTEALQLSAQALLIHIDANTAIVPLDDCNAAYIVIGDNCALMRLCRAITPVQEYVLSD